MAITHDATTNGSAGSATSLTYSHTCASSAYLLIGSSTFDLSSHTISSVTYAGASCTAFVTVQGTDLGVFGRAGFYEKTAPASGANDVVITASEEMVYGIAGNATSRLGVGSTGTPVSSAGNTYGTATDPSLSGIGAASGELAVDLLNDFGPIGGTYTVGSGQTERCNINAPRRTTASEKDGADTMTWTNSNDSWGPWGYVALKLVPSGGGGGSVVPVLMAEYRRRKQ